MFPDLKTVNLLYFHFDLFSDMMFVLSQFVTTKSSETALSKHGCCSVNDSVLVIALDTKKHHINNKESQNRQSKPAGLYEVASDKKPGF